MCAFCGGLVREKHWTDRLESSEPGAESAATWRRGRQAQVGLVNRVLRRWGLEVRDWSAHVFVLSDQTGRSEVVPHLAAVWTAAERLGRGRCDPLDPALLASLESAGGVEREPARGA
jgi:hypothetical protein